MRGDGGRRGGEGGGDSVTGGRGRQRGRDSGGIRYHRRWRLGGGGCDVHHVVVVVVTEVERILRVVQLELLLNLIHLECVNVCRWWSFFISFVATLVWGGCGCNTLL